jgi:hypothetical protein
MAEPCLAKIERNQGVTPAGEVLRSGRQQARRLASPPVGRWRASAGNSEWASGERAGLARFGIVGAAAERTWREERPQVAESRSRLQELAVKRAVQLVWRHEVTRSTAAGTALPAGPSAAALPHGAPRDLHIAGNPGTTNGGPSVFATALDPVLANRLAEDVIRRIDRRASIERERRGL